MAVLAQTIILSDVIKEMDTGHEFSIGFRTFNKIQETGGEYIEFERCIKSGSQPKDKNAKALMSGEKFRKDPRHWENSTRNIVVLPEGNIVKVHLRLIIFFNGKTVI